MGLSKTTTHDHNTSVTPVIQPEEIEEIDMGISPAAMKLIIDRLTDLYPHPIDSSVREVVSNAIDATAKLPVEERQAVEIYSPTALNASFRVIDHGVGMSADDVRKIYSQYGGSTKADDFTQLGAYGLGAKAPLAYCSEFQVTTTKDGVTTIFTCARKAMGNKTAIVSTKTTGLPNGTEVVLPVKSHDLGEFQRSIYKFKQFAPDVPLNIDGAEVKTEDKYQLFDTIMLDEDSGTLGRVWINNATARDYFLNIMRQRYSYRNVSIKYVLSGWVYDLEGVYNDATFIVELKPGVVDFSSSRDSITRNERSRDLHARVTKYYSNLNDDLLQKAFTYLRELTPKAAWTFLSDLDLRRTATGFELAHQNKTFAVAESDFALVKGENPLTALAAPVKNNAFGILDLNTEARNYNFTVGEMMNANDLGIRGRSTNGRVGDITAAMQKVVEDGTKSSLLHAVLATRASSSYYHETKNRPLVIVTGVDKDFTEEVRKNRPLLSTEIFPNHLMALATKVSSKEVDLFREILEVEVTVTTPAKVMDRIVEARIERRKNAVKREIDTEVYAAVWDATDFTEVKEFNSHHREGERVRVSEIIDNNHFIVIGDDPLSVLRGAVNKGAKPLGKKVYVLPSKELRAGHFSLMLGYRDVYLGPDFVARSKAAESLAAHQVRHARLFAEEIQALTPQQVVRCVPASTLFSDTMWLEFAAAASGTEYQAAFDAFTDIDRNFNQVHLYSPSLDDLLPSAFGPKVAEKIKLISSVMEGIEDYGSFELRVFSALKDMRYYGGPSNKTPKNKHLLEAIVPYFVEHVIEKADELSLENAKAPAQI